MDGQVFAHNFKVVPGSATQGAQLAAATDIPASGSYVDVSDAEMCHIVARLGVVHASDEPTLQVKCSDAVDGTLDAISGLAAHTVAADDDNEFVTWSINVSALPTDHHFLAVDVAGTVSNGSYADINFYLQAKDRPVTQTTAVLPTASQYYWNGE